MMAACGAGGGRCHMAPWPPLWAGPARPAASSPREAQRSGPVFQAVTGSRECSVPCADRPHLARRFQNAGPGAQARLAPTAPCREGQARGPGGPGLRGAGPGAGASTAVSCTSPLLRPSPRPKPSPLPAAQGSTPTRLSPGPSSQLPILSSPDPGVSSESLGPGPTWDWRELQAWPRGLAPAGLASSALGRWEPSLEPGLPHATELAGLPSHSSSRGRAGERKEGEWNRAHSVSRSNLARGWGQGGPGRGRRCAQARTPPPYRPGGGSVGGCACGGHSSGSCLLGEHFPEPGEADAETALGWGWGQDHPAGGPPRTPGGGSESDRCVPAAPWPPQRDRDAWASPAGR